MLLAFGTSQHPQPAIIPIRVIRMLDAAGNPAQSAHNLSLRR